MSIFGNIVSKIFGSRAAQANAPQSSAGSGASQQQGSSQQGSQQSSFQQQNPAQQSSTGLGSQQTAPSAMPMSRSQVEDMIQKIADQRGQKYNWRESIVDLMKLLDLDSGLPARKQLAQELGYPGPLDGSAEMNIWLHKQVMDRLAQSGGKVPDDLKH